VLYKKSSFFLVALKIKRENNICCVMITFYAVVI